METNCQNKQQQRGTEITKEITKEEVRKTHVPIKPIKPIKSKTNFILKNGNLHH